MKTLTLSKRHGIKITFIYLVISTAWIVFSDRLVSTLVSDPTFLVRIQTYKGMFFVLVTSGLLYYLISLSTSSIEKSRDRMEELLRKNQALLSELHHRVKNNLAIIAGLIELQTEEMVESDAVALRETQFRIYTLADIEELIYQGEDVENIPFHELMNHLVSMLGPSWNNKLSVQAEIDEVYLNINQAVPLGLLVNEIFSQFRTNEPAGASGAINVKLSHLLPNTIILELRFEEIPSQIQSTLLESNGIEATLIELYTKQLKATSGWESGQNGGAFRLEFEKSDRPGFASRLARSD